MVTYHYVKLYVSIIIHLEVINIFLLLLLLLLFFLSRDMNVSAADLRNYWTEFHETWWSYRYMFLVDPIFQICGKGGQRHIFRGSTCECRSADYRADGTLGE
jgi:hypothetical protein